MRGGPGLRRGTRERPRARSGSARRRYRARTAERCRERLAERRPRRRQANFDNVFAPPPGSRLWRRAGPSLERYWTTAGTRANGRSGSGGTSR